MPDIFLSYSRDDLHLMAQVRDDLQAQGWAVWTDEGIHPGTESWKRSIEDAIKSAQCLVCLLSPSAAQSRWVRAELDFAETQKKQIFLVLASGDEADVIPFGYATHQWVDIRDSYEPLKSNLIPTVKAFLGSGSASIETTSLSPHSVPLKPTRRSTSWLWVTSIGVIVALFIVGIFLINGRNRANEQATATAVAYAAADSDGDGLTNAQEATHRTDPNNPDTDGDGLLDGDEIDRYDTKPRDEDTDKDRLLDGEEIRLGTDPNERDSDGDRLTDGVEMDTGTNPNLPDSDRDGVTDEVDVCHNEPDVGYGIDARGCPTNPNDQDGDEVEDALDACPIQGDVGFGVDEQGCPNATPNPDPDGDGLTDAFDQCPNAFGSASTFGCPDTDNDGVSDNNDSCPLEGSTGQGINEFGCPLSGDDGATPDQSPEDFIRDYYAAIKARDYGFTWSHLTNVFKDRWNCPAGFQNDDYTCNTLVYDYDGYIGWWNAVDEVIVTETIRECLEDNIAVVITSLEYKLSNGSEYVQEDSYVKLINLGGEWHFHDVGQNKRTCVFDPWA